MLVSSKQSSLTISPTSPSPPLLALRANISVVDMLSQEVCGVDVQTKNILGHSVWWKNSEALRDRFRCWNE